MIHRRFGSHCLVAATLALSAPLLAQAAPGEDPIILEKKVSVQMMPINQNRSSGYINYGNAVPGQLQAKINRYVAKAFAANTDGIFTEKDVVQSVQTKGSKVTCAQSVGSNVGAAAANVGKTGKPGEQIVVLRGDLVNVCF